MKTRLTGWDFAVKEAEDLPSCSMFVEYISLTCYSFTEGEGMTMSFDSPDPIFMNPIQESAFSFFICFDLSVDDTKFILSYFIRYSSIYYSPLTRYC